MCHIGAIWPPSSKWNGSLCKYKSWSLHLKSLVFSPPIFPSPCSSSSISQPCSLESTLKSRCHTVPITTSRANTVIMHTLLCNYRPVCAQREGLRFERGATWSEHVTYRKREGDKMWTRCSKRMQLNVPNISFNCAFIVFHALGTKKSDVCDLWRALHPYCQGLAVLKGCLLEAGVTQIHLKKVCTGSKHTGVAPNRRYADKHAGALIGFDTSVWQQLKTWVCVWLRTLMCVCMWVCACW